MNEKIVASLLRVVLKDLARSKSIITYANLARSAKVPGPYFIHKTCIALELIIEQDVAKNRPLLAAIVISKTRNELPAPGFFQHLTKLGVYCGPEQGKEAAIFHACELKKVWDFYCD
ncbi:hypothetical protein A1OE_544 [Candidatus Endolissoclinum faulkneri L2]|uniref:Uncharacterized protein n=1 Tax=Candidatus Endolissoclinum faulkneri L2 TaxID=1193729 RepID=K7YMJ0_9PROT|nr:hypothetical protein [Candidatus Endolissoclinum faulkneri]AFX98737.1 hypothetical protein A1OE_544 [Candidatus Endolissoclinum faulkneri L2]